MAYIFNKQNGIPIDSWKLNKEDDELLKLMPLLRFLSIQNDIREINKEIIIKGQIKYEKVKDSIKNYCNIKNNINKNIYKKIVIPKINIDNDINNFYNFDYRVNNNTEKNLNDKMNRNCNSSKKIRRRRNKIKENENIIPKYITYRENYNYYNYNNQNNYNYNHIN